MQLLQAIRLLDETRPPLVGEALGCLPFRVAAAKNDRDLALNSLHFAKGTDPVHPGHGQIEQDTGKLVGVLFEESERFLPIRRGDGPEAQTFDERRPYLAHGVLVVTPEALSVENAYRFLKVAFLRRIRNAELSGDVEELLQEAAREGGSGARTPAELMAHINREAPVAGQVLTRLVETFRPLLVVNQVRTTQDLALADSMCQAARRLFGVALEPLGALHHCDTLARAVRARLPVIPENLGVEAVTDLGRLVTRLLGLAVVRGTR